MSDADLADRRLNEIAAASLDGPGVTRLPWTEAHGKANALIRGWMEDAGLVVDLDAAGTLVGRSPQDAGKPVILLGSHQDSVRNGGRYDGIMGVALACLAARRFRDNWAGLPVAVRVLAFADEEGVRFPTALIGPRALAGTLDAAVFDLTDRDGIRMGDAMRDFGADPDGATGLAMKGRDVLAYIEAHIEQGPVLEQAGVPVGVVTGICGITRFLVRFSGETGHAGTVPMVGRRDALVGMSRFVDGGHRAALAQDGLRATVGQVEVRPNVVNAIPEQVTLTLETRSTDDAARAGFGAAMHDLAQEVADNAGLGLDWERTYDQPAVACDPTLRAHLGAAARAVGVEAPDLPSGATHDASAMADLCPVGMLFLRCRGGISHRPDEYASGADMAVAVDVLARTISALAAKHT